MLEHVSKHPAVASAMGGSSVCSAGLGQMESLSTDVNVTGHAGADTIYRGNNVYII